MFERFDPSRNIMTQYWEQKYSTAFTMQNPYWTQKRMLREARKQRYMFNASLKYDILPGSTSWVVYVPTTPTLYMKKNTTRRQSWCSPAPTRVCTARLAL